MIKFTDHFIVFQEVPDEITMAINISNCPNNCVGCHSPHLKENIGTSLNIQSLDKIINPYKNEITCICLMGGDRFPEEINRFANYITHTLHLKVAWYSGKDEISQYVSLENFDYIKIGHYNPTLGPLSSKTTNQRFYKINQGKLENITQEFWK